MKLVRDTAKLVWYIIAFNFFHSLCYGWSWGEKYSNIYSDKCDKLVDQIKKEYAIGSWVIKVLETALFIYVIIYIITSD